MGISSDAFAFRQAQDKERELRANEGRAESEVETQAIDPVPVQILPYKSQTISLPTPAMWGWPVSKYTRNQTLSLHETYSLENLDDWHYGYGIIGR